MGSVVGRSGFAMVDVCIWLKEFSPKSLNKI